MGLLWRILSNFLVYTCFGSLIFVFMSLGGLLRLLPRLLRLLFSLLRALLILSFRLYALLISQLSPLFEHLFHVSLRQGLGRLLACLTFSLVLGLIGLWLFGLPIAWWHIGLLLLHGVTVSLVWEEIQKPGSLQLGERIK